MEGAEDGGTNGGEFNIICFNGAGSGSPTMLCTWKTVSISDECMLNSRGRVNAGSYFCIVGVV